MSELGVVSLQVTVKTMQMNEIVSGKCTKR